MDWSILLEAFMDNNTDIYNSCDDINKDEHICDYVNELKSYLKEEQKDRVDCFKTGIINFLEFAELEHLKQAIYFGVKCGMEIQKMLDEFYYKE